MKGSRNIKRLRSAVAGPGLAFAAIFVVSVVQAQLPTSVPLLAGQNTFVGFVDVARNESSGNLEVTYSLEGAWCLQHVHTHVANDENGIPQTRRGGPIPGQFQVNESVDCAASKTVSLGPVPEDDFVVAAHAVVSALNGNCQAKAVLYGTDQNTGSINEIEIGADDCVVTSLVETNNLNPGQRNGLAYDQAKNRLYFSVKKTAPTGSGSADGSVGELWAASLNDFMPVVEQVHVGAPFGRLNGNAASGGFFMNEYWYIENRSDRLKKVTFFDEVDGIYGVEAFYCDIDGVVGDLSTIYRFGDIVVAPGTTKLLASTNGPDRDRGFFSVDLNNSCTNLITHCRDLGNEFSGVGQCADSQQLAYGSNGVLYGHAVGSGKLYVVDTAGPNAGKNTAEVCSGIDIGSYTDLASGPQCKSDPIGEETAWGDGDPFVRRGNWATYIRISQ